jgi:drug/metabolite transporter (DMT)-like permease
MGTWEYSDMRRSTLSLLLLSVMAQWGLAFVAIRVLVDHASAVTITLLRFVLAGAALAGVMALTRQRYPRVRREDRWRVLVIALVSVITYHLALNFGEHYVSAGVASLIVAAAPVMTAVLSARVLHERIPPAKALGIVAALAGVAVLVVGGADGDLRIENVGGALVTAIAPLSFAVSTVTAKPIVPRYGALPLTSLSLLLGTAILLPFALPTTVGDLSRLEGADWGRLAFLGLGCTAYAYWVWNRALLAFEASSVAPWTYLVPVFALGWAAILLGERVTALSAVGGVMILGGVIFTERVAPRLAARRRAERAEVVGDIGAAGGVHPRA